LRKICHAKIIRNGSATTRFGNLRYRWCSSSWGTSRPISTAGYKVPNTAASSVIDFAMGCTGVMSPKPRVVSETKLK
jgi:hypothetical protein